MKLKSLKHQFTLWTILLVVVPSLLIMAIYTAGQIRTAKQQNLELIKQRVASQARLIDYWMTERSADVRIISQSTAFRTLDEQQMKRSLFAVQQANNNFDSLSYIDKDGLFRLSTLSTGIHFPSAVGRPYFQAALAGGEFISDVVIGRNSGLQIINFSSPIFDNTGNFQGLILGSIRTTTLEALLHDNWIGQTGEVFLVNREGTMLTEPRNVITLIDRGLVRGTAKMKLTISADAFSNIRLGDSGTATWVDYLGNKVLGAYLYVPERGWTIIGKINEAEVLGPIYMQLAMMAGGTILLVLLLMPLATRITNQIKQPIDWLIRQANLVKTENYAMVVRDKCGENIANELDTLCETFVDMSHKIGSNVVLLKENEAKLARKVVEIQDINVMLEEEIMERQAVQTALQQLNAELESRVVERTSALQDINTVLEEEIVEREAAQNALHEINAALTVTKARYQALFEHMQNAFNIRKVIVDSDGQPVDLEYVDVNPAFERMYGLKAADVIGRRVTEVFPGVDKEPFDWIKLLGEVALTGQPVIVEQYFKSGGKWLRLEAYSPEKGFVASVMQDITEGKRSEEQLKHYSDELTASNVKLTDLNDELRRISLSDGLTGIANRRYFDEYLEREWQRAKRDKTSLALVMLDVDFFKSYNDTYGHIAGDECLKLIASMLKALPKRVADSVARYGGEEFAIVLPDTDREGAAIVGEKVRAGVENLGIEHKSSAISKYVTVSVGVAIYVPDQGETSPIIIAAADRALYQAKTEGRNLVRVAE